MSRNKIYGIIVTVLVLLYSVKFLSFESFVLPTSGRIDVQRQKIKQLEAELSNLEKMSMIREDKKARIKEISRGFWKSHGEKIPTNEIQLKIERIGKKSGVNLNKVGAPKIAEVSDNIRVVDVSVSSTTNTKSLTEFLREINNHDPKLFWNDCVIRPNRTKEPTAVNISGKLRTYLLAGDALTYLEGELAP